MRYSNTAIRELSARYKGILKKCFLINMSLFLGMATFPANAAIEIFGEGVHTSSSGKTYPEVNEGGSFLGGWKVNTANGGAVQSGFNGDIYVTDGDWERVVGGNYVRKVTLDNDADISMNNSQVVIDGENTRVYTVVGGMLGNDAGGKNTGNSTAVTINNGEFGRYKRNGNVLEQVVTAGDLIKASYSQPDMTTHLNNAHLKITGGTFYAPVLGGSVAYRYYSGGTEKALTASVDNVNMDISGGTFNNPIVAGGMASNTDATSTVGQANIHISGDTGNLTINDNIYTGRLYHEWENGSSTASIDKVVLDVKNATVQGIYDTDVKASQASDANGIDYWAFTPDTESSSAKTTTATLTNVTAKDNILINTGSLTMKNVTAEKDVTLKNGTLTVDGLLTLNGAITNTDTVTFKEGSSLKAALDQSTALIQADTIKGTTAFVFESGSKGGTVTFDSANQSGFKFIENALFDLTVDNGVYTFTKKSTEATTETLTQAGVSVNDATAIASIAETAATGNAQVDNVLNMVTTAMQTGDVAAAEAVVQQINPVVAPVTQAVSTNVAVLGAAMTRMTSLTVAPAPTTGTGRSGGDVSTSKLAPWIQGVYSKNHNSQGIGFNAYSQGFALGADTELTDDWTVGLGYAYTATDIKDTVRKTQAYGDNVFAYAQYKPSDWYINSILNYGHTNYKEKSTLVGADYSIDTYGAQVMAGYKWNVMNNYAGVRYTYIDMDKYTNGVTEIDTKNAQVATAVIGTKVSKNFTFGKNAILTPEFRIAGTYDFKSDNSTTNVGIVGTQSMYTVNGERLSRAAIETGVGLTTRIDNWELSLNYDAALRSENNTQSGMFKSKYNF